MAQKHRKSPSLHIKLKDPSKELTELEIMFVLLHSLYLNIFDLKEVGTGVLLANDRVCF